MKDMKVYFILCGILAIGMMGCKSKDTNINNVQNMDQTEQSVQADNDITDGTQEEATSEEEETLQNEDQVNMEKERKDKIDQVENQIQDETQNQQEQPEIILKDWEDKNMGEWETPAGFKEKQEGVSYATMKRITYQSETTGTTRKCIVILPAGYSKERSYPVLYLLHGIGGTETEWMGGAPDIIVSNLVAAGLAKEMILVLPNVRAAADASVPAQILGEANFNAFDNFINDLKHDLMPYIEANYAVKTGRENTAIAGLSMGGRETLYIGFQMPETFGYIGAFSPAPGWLPYANLGYAGQMTEEELVFPSDISAPYLLICNGNTDHTIGTVPTEYHEALTRMNIEHDFYTMDGDHNFTVWSNGFYNFVKRIFK